MRTNAHRLTRYAEERGRPEWGKPQPIKTEPSTKMERALFSNQARPCKVDGALPTNPAGLCFVCAWLTS